MSVVCVDEGGQHIWGPQFVWTKPSVRHVPQTEAEAEATIGTEVVNSDLKLVPLFEHAIIAKSRVISTPVTSTGLMSSPCPVARANVTQES